MKYTNKHIKEEYKFNQMWRTIGMLSLIDRNIFGGIWIDSDKEKDGLCSTI